MPTALKKLTKIGNSYAMILPKQVLKLVGIDPKKTCRLSVAKSKITIEPRSKEKTLDEEISQAMLRFMKKYRFDLSKLGASK